MRKSVIVALISVGLLASAHAQQNMSPEQRLALQIANLSLQNAQQASQIETLQAQVAALNKQIADLHVSNTPKPPSAAQ